MNPLETFIKEHASDSTSSDTPAPSDTPPIISGGDLVIVGSVDWDNATSKGCVGLDTPHVIPFECPVARTFSSSSSNHLFILLADGRLYALGKNDNGQLGIGSSGSTQHAPVLVPEFSGAVLKKVSTGKHHTLFLMDNGEVFACGSNACGQLGLGLGPRDVSSPRKLSIARIRDIACGYEHSLICSEDGQVYSFGHPQCGQLGDGTSDGYLMEGKKGIQYSYTTSPTLIREYLTKDNKGNITGRTGAMDIKIRSVAAGKNHSWCIEEWEETTEDGTVKDKPSNRVFSWGFGGYGRLGHNGVNDESIPREVCAFVSPRPSPQKQIREVYCGSSYTVAVSKSQNLYFCGILPNSPRGEASIYPRMQQELLDWNTRIISGGSSWVLVAADSACVFWGTTVAGRFGLDGGAKSSANPTFLSALGDINPMDISCGYAHACLVIAAVDSSKETEYTAMLSKLPLLSEGACKSDPAKDTKKKRGAAEERASSTAKGSKSKRGRKK